MMRVPIKEYHRVSDLKEAIRILRQGKGRLVPLAGGSSLALRRRPKVRGVVDINDLPLRYIKKKASGIEVGALTRMSEIEEDPLTRKYADGILSSCARVIAPGPIRNMITLGGNITAIFPWSDMPVNLLVLNAKIVIQGARKRKVSAVDYYANHPQKTWKPEIVTAVEFPNLPSGSSRAVFRKFARLDNDYPLVDMASVIVRDKGGKIKDIRVAVSAVTKLPRRAVAVEKYLKGKKITDETVTAAVEIFRENLKDVAQDIRASVEYRRDVACVILKRMLRGDRI